MPMFLTNRYRYTNMMEDKFPCLGADLEPHSLEVCVSPGGSSVSTGRFAGLTCSPSAAKQEDVRVPVAATCPHHLAGRGKWAATKLLLQLQVRGHIFRARGSAPPLLPQSLSGWVTGSHRSNTARPVMAKQEPDTGGGVELGKEKNMLTHKPEEKTNQASTVGQEGSCGKPREEPTHINPGWPMMKAEQGSLPSLTEAGKPVRSNSYCQHEGGH